MTLQDSAQRSQATNPAQSYIVQAPAGSGKTEILTQRYLRLLSTVTAPEQIVALTFTRKAASEMRERIIIALQKAAANELAQSSHQQKTLDYAQQALSKSQQLSWDLLLQPNRLKIITIDSLCQTINNSIPLIDKQIAYPNITDKPGTYYLNAARSCIQFALITNQYQQAIKTLLLHVDNKQEKLIELFSTLLSQRDQWLSLLFQARELDKTSFEQALKFIEQHELARFKQSLPDTLAAELTRLARTMAIIENDPSSARFPLCEWHSFYESNQDTATALAKLLLTGEQQFRNAFDHHVGLKKGVCSDAEYAELKAASKLLLEQLKDHPDFLESLIQVSQLPNPEYDPEQWQVLQALFVLLPLLVGHLHLTFSEQNEVDFTAISQQALAALGDDENPTDLALYLDNSIHHLLVDEFQDTSITQFELLTKLVQGWQKDEGKTLFIVGDPMQSIYRFRQAEVGLFFRAKEQGIGPVELQSLELSCNFRSTKTIVSWVNQQFSKVFPQQVDIESGAVSFHSSAHVLEGDESSQVQALQFKNKQQEALYLVEKIKQELTLSSDKTIAILVRSRTQLKEIISLLREHSIPYQGTDIDLLANLMHLRDAWSLTQALLSPANRLSWLALLRSPYCGLRLEEVHLIASYNSKQSIYCNMLELDNIAGLSDEGRSRAAYFIQVMHKALTHRYQTHLSDWVAHTLKELHIEKIVNDLQLQDLEQLWTLMDGYEQQGRIPDLNQFQKELDKLYSQQSMPSRVQVMTIHKSKGLEFDTVFLPGLGAQPNQGDKPMLRWLKLATHHHDNLLLVSPIKGAYQDQCSLYDYLQQLDQEKSVYEAQRVLYVAATRAKSQLYLLNSSSKTSKGSFASLLKHQEFEQQELDNYEEEALTPLPILSRLPAAIYSHATPTGSDHLNPPTQLVSSTPRLTGIVAHQILEWICAHHPESAQQIPWHLAQFEYKKMGLDEEAQQLALSTLQTQISQLFQDEVGLWIISPHQAEKNEYELLVTQQDRMVTRIIDRCFIYQNAFWIIDFKTGKEDLNSLEKHQKQLNEYAFHLSSRTELPIHCGLYYLPNTHWHHWQSYVARITLR